VVLFRSGNWYIDTDRDKSTDITFSWGKAGDIPVFGDYNRDGYDDVVLFRSGNWYIDTDRDQSTDITFSWGKAGDIPVFGDYNRDGHDDGVLFRSGSWYIDTDRDQSADIRFTWGKAGDIPLFGGYNKPADLTVTEKFETPLGNSTFTVTYTVCNIGEEDAGASTTNIYIADVEVATDPVSALSAGECYTNTVGPFDCPCGTTVSVKVCADDKEIVTESDEKNNCKESYVKCQECPAIAIEVHKTVWNTKTSEWADAIQANVSDVVRFRIWLNNSGDYNLTSIVANDTLSDGFEYADNATVTPDVINNNPNGTTTLYWNFAGPLEYSQSVTIEFDARKTRIGKGRNGVNVSGWCNETGPDVQVFDEDCAFVRGKTDDVVLFRSGNWYIDTDRDQSTDIRFTWGKAGDIPLFGDYNRDGHDDVVLFRSGNWYIDTDRDQSTDIRFSWGKSGDIPLFGDYNRDGHDDVVLFRSGNWYIDTNRDQSTDIRFSWGKVGDIPLFGIYQ